MSTARLLLTQARKVRDAGASAVPGVPSPCVSVCRMDAAGLCEGCLRTIDEIAGWSTMADPAKRAVWAGIEGRALAAIAAARAQTEALAPHGESPSPAGQQEQTP